MLPILIVFLPFALAVISYGIGRKSEKLRDGFVLLSAFAELILVGGLFALALLQLDAEMTVSQTVWLRVGIPCVFNDGLSFQTDGFRAVYALVAAFMWAFTTLFSRQYFEEERENLSRYYLFVLMTLGATEGVMLSGDLVTTFLFFEILSLTSCTWVMHEETPGALRAGYTYLFIAVIGGLVCFMGMALLQHTVGTLSFDLLPGAVAALNGEHQGTLVLAGLLILFGYGCKAGMFPVHVWLPKAHPVAPAPASALLSGILTKVGIYGILMTTLSVLLTDVVYGWIVLILGTITMALGAVLALFSVNLKRTLACSSMSQIGFILIGIAMTVLLTAAGDEEGAEVALSGAMLHMVNHSMLKLSLFCAAGAVVMNIHALDLDTIRGFGRNKTTLKTAFFLGLLGISGVPLFNGYASKTLLHESITAGIHFHIPGAGLLHGIEWIFLVSGGCTFCYMLKLFICVFVEKNLDPALQEKYDKKLPCMTPGSTIAVLGSSLLFVILGQKAVFGRLARFMTGKPEALLEFHPLSWECVSGGLISLGIGACLYLFLIRKLFLRQGHYVNLWPSWLDLEDLFYRPLLTSWLPFVFGSILGLFGKNRLSAPFAKGITLLAGKAASLFGENRLLRPVARFSMFLYAVLGRAFSDSMDFLVILSRKTFVREKKAAGSSARKRNALTKQLQKTVRTLEPVVGNFTFALMLSCAGIVAVLVPLLLYVLRM